MPAGCFGEFPGLAVDGTPPRTWEFLPGQEGFFALLGSVLGGTVARMLADNGQELHWRTVEKIVLIRANGAAEDA